MKRLVGKVVSSKMKNTIVVEVEITRLHPLYRKHIKRSKRFKVHCEDQTVKEGDIVKIVPTRPISREKHYKLLK